MSKRILVINDTQELLELFRILFETEGYEVILSGNPVQKDQEPGPQREEQTSLHKKASG